jgi:hypothetical protein
MGTEKRSIPKFHPLQRGGPVFNIAEPDEATEKGFVHPPTWKALLIVRFIIGRGYCCYFHVLQRWIFIFIFIFLNKKIKKLKNGKGTGIDPLW